VQIKVTSGGSVALPSGIALPGAYDPTDTNGILVELWKYDQNLAYYIPPGGPVVLPGGTGSWGRETFGGTPQQPIGGASSSTVRPTTSAPSTTSSTPRPVTSSTTVRTTSTAAPPASTGTIQKYGQVSELRIFKPDEILINMYSAAEQAGLALLDVSLVRRV
jgi:cellulase